MAVWKIHVENKAESKVNVMIFQTVPDDLRTGSYFTAWRVLPTGDAGNFYLELPEAFEFSVIDRLNDVERHTALQKVSYGQHVDVTQTNAEDQPEIKINSLESIPKDRITVFNKSGNAQKLEMALSKNGSKMVFYKDINPGVSVIMAIKPTVYMSAVAGIKQGQEFLTEFIFDGVYNLQMSDPRQANFKLLEEKPVINIQLTQKPSGEYKFTEL